MKKIILIVSILLLGFCVSSIFTQPSCSGIKASDGSSYDLSQLSTAGILNAPQTGTDGTPYVYNVTVCGNQPMGCNNANCAGPNTAGICQTWSDGSGSHARCCGRFDGSATVVALTGKRGVVITYDNGDACGSCLPAGPRSTILTILCGGSGVWSPVTVTGGAPNIPAIIYINGTSGTLCGGSGSLSGGWIFIIILLCLGFVYLIGGIIFNAAIRKQSGKEMIPNITFWSDMPGLIADGGRFIGNKVRGKSGYQTVGQ